MKFGLLTYDTDNLGDEIQSLAAMHFLPRTDVLLPRENLCVDPGVPGPVATILNGWFLHRPERWPPHRKIFPLPVSMHLSTSRPSRWKLWTPRPASTLLAKPGVEWFRSHGPIGARDQRSLELLQSRGIDAYLSYCLTLTLPRSTQERVDRVVACDLPAEILAALRERLRTPVVATSHCDDTTRGHEARMAQARERLALYSSAKAVVTTRLHCALPCLALGTPVLYLHHPIDADRQQPAMALAHVTTAAQLLAGKVAFNPDDPPANPTTYQPFAQALARRCREFIASAIETPRDASEVA